MLVLFIQFFCIKITFQNSLLKSFLRLIIDDFLQIFLLLVFDNILNRGGRSQWPFVLVLHFDVLAIINLWKLDSRRKNTHEFIRAQLVFHWHFGPGRWSFTWVIFHVVQVISFIYVELPIVSRNLAVKMIQAKIWLFMKLVQARGHFFVIVESLLKLERFIVWFFLDVLII
jgi:hypothetical protein